MSRAFCPTCQRPLRVCLCPAIESVENRVEIGLLQHPTEASQIKGTAVIARLSLTRCRYWCAETLEEAPGLLEWLQHDELFVLYPDTPETTGTMAQCWSVEQVRARYPASTLRVLVIDGTWRKAHKMMMLNPALQHIKRIALQPAAPSDYRIRKQKGDTLVQLEGEVGRFQPLMGAFEWMVRQQLEFRPKRLSRSQSAD
jgi:DTW domain-containing protein YfiP